MMTAAILLKAGAKTSAPNVASTAHDASDNISFAESFNKSAVHTTSSQREIFLDGKSARLHDSKSTEPMNRSDEVTKVRVPVGEKGATGYRGLEPAGLKSPSAEATAVSRPMTMVTRSQETGDSMADGVEALDQEDPGGRLVTGRDNQQPADTYELNDREAVPLTATGMEESPGIPSGGSSAAVTRGKRTYLPEKDNDVASGKKVAVSPESSATLQIAPKSVGLVESGSASQPKVDLANPPGGDVSSAGPSVAALAAPQDEIGSTTKDISISSSVAVPPTPLAFTVAAGSARSEDAHSAKAGITELGVTGTPDTATASEKSGMNAETTASSLPAGDSSDGKIQSTSGPVQGLAHVTMGGVETSSGSVAVAALHGSAQGEIIVAKAQAGDPISSPSGSHNGVREQEGPLGLGTSMGETPRMLLSTPTSLEIGVPNGMHGWLKIRAEMTEGGMVNASVSTASSTGQEMLHRELPSLTAYLAEEKVAVNALVVNPSHAAGADARNSSGMDGAGGQASQRSDGGDRDESLEKAALNDPGEATTYQSSQGSDEDVALAVAGFGIGGGWLSVRA